MAAIDIIRPRTYSVDLNISCSPAFKDTLEHVMHGLIASSPTLTGSPRRSAPVASYAAAMDEDDDEPLFPDLPPLLEGRPEVHLRSGVMRAARLAADAEPDAERAFFVCDLSQVYAQHMRFKQALPEIEPFYAVKCNPDPYVVRLLAALGAGFDCASNGEIAQVLGVGGIAPERIIFANPCKPTSFVRAAQRAGVELMTFDNTDELHKIARVFPRAKLVLRILTDDSAALCRLGLKFGAALDAVPGLLAQARVLELDVVGISFHVGSGSQDPSAFADAILRAKAAFGMGAEAGYTFKLLDVGGGFEHHAEFEKRAAVLRTAIEEHFPDRRAQGLRIIAEPGRFYVAQAFRLAANIIARRAPSPAPAANSGAEGNEQTAVMYYINDGVYGAFNCILFDHQVVHPYVLSMGGSFHVPSSAALAPASVWGPTCDSIDLVSPSAMLPAQLRVGDWLAFDDMGAYTRCAASRFNGFEVSQVVYTLGAGQVAGEVRRALAAFARAADDF